MKKYQNVTAKSLCVEFQTFAQFLFRGQFVVSDEKPKTVPEGIVVTDVEEPKEEAKKAAPKKKRVVKKKASQESVADEAEED